MLKIAITGKMGSGKSSLTKFIQDLEDGYVTSYSSIIKRTLLALDLEPTRNLMQETGDFFRKYDKLVWTNQLIKEIQSIEKTVVIEGIRYPFEGQTLVKKGFIIIKVEANEEIRKKRIASRNNITIDDETWKIWSSHPTETFVDEIQANFTLYNNNSTQDLKNSIISILNDLKNSNSP